MSLIASLLRDLEKLARANLDEPSQKTKIAIESFVKKNFAVAQAYGGTLASDAGADGFLPLMIQHFGAQVASWGPSKIEAVRSTMESLTGELDLVALGQAGGVMMQTYVALTQINSAPHTSVLGDRKDDLNKQIQLLEAAHREALTAAGADVLPHTEDFFTLPIQILKAQVTVLEPHTVEGAEITTPMLENIIAQQNSATTAVIKHLIDQYRKKPTFTIKDGSDLAAILTQLELNIDPTEDDNLSASHFSSMIEAALKECHDPRLKVILAYAQTQHEQKKAVREAQKYCEQAIDAEIHASIDPLEEVAFGTYKQMLDAEIGPAIATYAKDAYLGEIAFAKLYKKYWDDPFVIDLLEAVESRMLDVHGLRSTHTAAIEKVHEKIKSQTRAIRETLTTVIPPPKSKQLKSLQRELLQMTDSISQVRESKFTNARDLVAAERQLAGMGKQLTKKLDGKIRFTDFKIKVLGFLQKFTINTSKAHEYYVKRELKLLKKSDVLADLKEAITDPKSREMQDVDPDALMQEEKDDDLDEDQAPDVEAPKAP